MRVLINLLLLFLLSGFNINAQNNYLKYYELINKAEDLAIKAKNDSSILIYLQAFENVDYIHINILESFIKTCKKSKNDTLIRKYSEILSRQKESINLEYKAVIDSLSKEDQRVRSKKYQKAVGYYSKTVLDSTFVIDQKKYQQTILLMDDRSLTDSLNIAALKELINKYGFPSEKQIGVYSYVNAVIILVHYDKDVGNKIMGEVLKTAIKNGELHPKDYDWITRRHNEISSWSKETKSIILY